MAATARASNAAPGSLARRRRASPTPRCGRGLDARRHVHQHEARRKRRAVLGEGGGRDPAAQGRRDHDGPDAQLGQNAAQVLHMVVEVVSPV